MLRAEVEAETPLGRQVASILASGGLAGDDLVSEMLVSRLRQPDCRNGFLLDGYPRTVPQAEFLDTFLEKHRYAPPLLLHLEVPEEVLVRRMSSRRQCPMCGRVYSALEQEDGVCADDGCALVRRKDDREEVIRERLRAFEEMTRAVAAHYRGRNCHRIDGNRAPAEISRDIRRILELASAEAKPGVQVRG
jgi:adenylate kinase